MTPDIDLAAALADKYKETGSFRKLAAALGMEPNRTAPLLSKVLRGEPVSDATARRIGRALGILPPPRKYHRVVMSDEEYAAWHACPKEERAMRLSGEAPVSSQQKPHAGQHEARDGACPPLPGNAVHAHTKQA